MKCPKCGSEQVTVQVVNKVKLVNAHHGIIWWLCIGWWWILVKWLVFTVPALILKIFGHKKQKAKNIQQKMAVCQSCGNSWKV